MTLPHSSVPGGSTFPDSAMQSTMAPPPMTTPGGTTWNGAMLAPFCSTAPAPTTQPLPTVTPGPSKASGAIVASGCTCVIQPSIRLQEGWPGCR